MPFARAIHRLTTNNRTRELALQLLTKTPDDLTEPQADLTVSPRMALMRLSRELGVWYFEDWLAGMTSRQYTQYRAMTIVETASRMVEAEHRKQK